MKKFFLGMVVGAALGAAIIAKADGYMSGWSVEIGGVEVCSDPYIWASTKTIECD